LEIGKFIGIAILICVIVVILKQVKPELSVCIMIIGGAILLLYVLNSFTSVITTFNEIITKTGVSQQLFSIVLKIVGVGYLIEFTADICKDSGNSSIADKVILGGKILILTLAIPIINSLFNVILELIQWKQ